jgi:nucleoside-diphosphate-sugar epimerase
MRIVVVGGTGNLGTSLIDALAIESTVTDLVVVARRSPDPTALPPSATFVVADVARDPLEPIFAGADVVVHLAWLFQPTHDPQLTWRTNAIGSGRVFDAVAVAGVRSLVYASSVGAYSPGAGRTVDESWPTHSTPTAAYGREKAYVERLLDTVEARHPALRVVRMRPSFIFKRTSGPEQRRLFAGPLVPRSVLRPGRIPIVPPPAGLRFQAVHSSDAARAFASAALGDVRGAFNIASDPVIDGQVLASILGARAIELPRALVRPAVAAAWRLRLTPTEPSLVDLALSLPVLDTTRAHTELGWWPTVSGPDAVREALVGMAEGTGEATPPLRDDSPATRATEVAEGVGQHTSMRRG